MKRRLELARGLIHYPKVLFLDEPTLGLDPQTRNRIWEYILQLREREGITIFLTTHYMDEAEHTHHIGIIDYGRIVALDTPDRLKDLVGGDVTTLRTTDDETAAQEIEERFGLSVNSHADEQEGLWLEVPKVRSSSRGLYPCWTRRSWPCPCGGPPWMMSFSSSPAAKSETRG